MPVIQWKGDSRREGLYAAGDPSTSCPRRYRGRQRLIAGSSTGSAFSIFRRRGEACAQSLLGHGAAAGDPQGRLKLVQYDTMRLEDGENGTASRSGRPNVTNPRLYNLAEDIGETKDLAAVYPEKLQELDAAWQAWNRILLHLSGSRRNVYRRPARPPHRSSWFTTGCTRFAGKLA